MKLLRESGIHPEKVLCVAECCWCIPIVLVFRENPVDCVWEEPFCGSSSAFHEFRTVIRNRWSIFEEYGLTGKRFKGKSANWIPKFARRIVSLGERKEREGTVRLEKGSVRSFQGRAGCLLARFL